jgi:hypothetical protein
MREGDANPPIVSFQEKKNVGTLEERVDAPPLIVPFPLNHHMRLPRNFETNPLQLIPSE